MQKQHRRHGFLRLIYIENQPQCCIYAKALDTPSVSGSGSISVTIEIHCDVRASFPSITMYFNGDANADARCVKGLTFQINLGLQPISDQLIWCIKKSISN